MKTSQRSNSVGRTKLRMMRELEAAFDNVISFTADEPDFPTPDHITEACKAALDARLTGCAPSQGVYRLRQAVARHLRETRGAVYAPEEVLITAGGMNALRAAAEALIDPGDEVLIPDPYWPNHFNHPRLSGGVPVPVPVTAESGCVYDIAALEARVTDRTKAVLLNSPANPTGALTDRRAMAALCAFVRAYDLILVSDECYDSIVFDGAEFVSPVMFDGMKERTILVSSLSASYAMTGWRLGYAAGPADAVGAMLRISENTLAGPAAFVQHAGIEALEGDQSCVREMTAELQKRRNLLCEALNAMPGVTCERPRGAFCAWADIRGTGLSSEEFAVRLLREKQVSVTPGDGFGPGGEGYVRMSFALDAEQLLEGARRMREFTDELARRRNFFKQIDRF